MIWFRIVCVFTCLTSVITDKISVTFVIDDTSSMSEDIDQVINGATEIFDAVSNCNNSQVDNFILVTFNDHLSHGHEPDVLIKTLDRDKFIDELSNIEVAGGGDCPEMSLTGIQLGLTSSHPGSYLYVFTDALARDYDLLDRVRNMAIKKKTQIVFIMTSASEVCKYDRSDKGYKVYDELAKATSGQVFHMDKEDVGKILKYVTETMKSRKDPIISKTFPPGEHEVPIPVDADVKSIVLAESGRESKISITSPDGDRPKVEDIVNITDVKVVKVVDPKPGIYTADVDSKSNTSVVVTAETGVTFDYGFSPLDPTSINATSSMPIAGVPTHLAVQVISDDEVELDKIELIGIDDKKIMEIPIKIIDAEKMLYGSKEKVVPPDGLFKIAIKGRHIKSNTSITRISKTPIEVQKVFPDSVIDKSPIMEIDKGPIVDVKHNDSLKLTCKVTAHPKPIITWTDEAGNILKSEISIVTLPDDYVAVLDIKVTKNSTFKCKANNDHGDISRNVKVQLVNYFNVLKAPKDTTIDTNKSDKIYCQIEAFPPVEIKWLKNGEILRTNDDFEVMDAPNALIVKKMSPGLVGEYVCSAKNDLKTEEMKFELQVTGTAPKISIDGPSKVSAEHGSSLVLICRASGYPEPQIKWYDQATGEELPSSVITAGTGAHEYGRELKLEVNKNTYYECEATNTNGKDIANVEVETLGLFEIVEPPKSTNYIENKKDGKIYCKVNASPPANILWLHSDETVLENNDNFEISPDNTTLTVRNMNPSLVDNYFCRLSNKYNYTNLAFRIEVGGLVKPAIKRTERDIFVLEGDSANFHCKIIKGIPAPTFSWKFRAESEKSYKLMEGTTDSVQLEKVSREQTGKYRCIAKNPKGKDSFTFSLNVEYPPTIEEPEKHIVTEATKKVMIKCLANGVPEPTVTWYLNGTPLRDGADYKIYRDNSISFMASHAKAGTYNCTANNKRGTYSITSEVEVFVPVAIDIPKETAIESIVGQEKKLPCVADGYPVPNIQWFFFNSSSVPSEPQLIKTAKSPDTLDLKLLHLSQDGYYTCVANNNVSQSNITYTITVNDKPNIIGRSRRKTNTVQAIKGDKLVRLPCKAVGRPIPEITWLNDKGLNVAAGSIWYDIDKDGSLIMKNVDKSEKFTCVAKNSLGSDRKNFNVVVSDFPIPSNPVAKRILKVGEPAEIRCPLPYTIVDNVCWFKGIKYIETRKETQLLMLRSVSFRDEGLYTCRVSTFGGIAQSSTIKVLVE